MGVHAPTNKETFPESIRNQSRIAQRSAINQDMSMRDPSLDNALVIKAPFTEKEITWEPRITISSARITIKHPDIYGKITPDHPQPV